MDFEVIPAVDIKNGKCVRLVRGRVEEETVFSEDPVEVALLFEEQGAGLIHVVDLDGAFAGRPMNTETITRIIDRCSVPVQVGGGIRTTDSATMYIESGAARVITGTRAIGDPSWLEEMVERFGERIVVGIDVKGGLVATSGWTESSDLTPREAISRIEDAGVSRIIYTEVSRDGTLEGPALGGIRTVAENTNVLLIASGGISGPEDVTALWRMRKLGIEGVIVGMALYRKKIILGDMLSELERMEETDAG